jgi:D-serine deaminase-like pyridoxal phosphate-dependent protein
LQYVDEAEAMIDGGVLDVFLSNQCIGSKKISRLCGLAKRGKMSVIVDNLDNVQQIGAAAVASGATIDVLIEVNAGQNRCGIEVLEDDGKLCVQLAQAVGASPNLRFKGVHCYHGAIQHTRDPEARRQQVLDGPVLRATKAVHTLEAAGIAVTVVTGGGTGTFPYESASGCFTEIQPGSYCFMDVDYGDNQDGKQVFENALFLHAMVISKTELGNGVARAVLDAETKASLVL